ncbi:hypothetical protein OSZ53_18765 (plasmid) [Edwardsiella ictaluri]
MNAVITDGGGDMPGADMQWHCEIFPLIQWINTACSDGLMSFTGAFKKGGGHRNSLYEKDLFWSFDSTLTSSGVIDLYPVVFS